MKPIKSVLVVGAGTMGHGFSQIFSLNGINVTLVDKNKELLDQARRWIQDNLEYMSEIQELKGQSVSNILDRIELKTDLDKHAKQTDFILEAVNEDLELKKQIFRQLDAVAPPDVVLASNTSSFDINEIGEVTEHPNRVIGTHWFHPPQITPCVEIIPSKATSPDIVERTISFMERIGKVPTKCKSAPGFVANRIQLAMAAEALSIVEEGLASPEEVDRIVKTSFGFRLGAYGPFEIIDQAGADTYRAVYNYLYNKLQREQFKSPRILDKLIEQGHYGLKTQKGFYEYIKKVFTNIGMAHLMSSSAIGIENFTLGSDCLEKKKIAKNKL
jgi:3-hydroxybutyryl-CoA dehydrogenase